MTRLVAELVAEGFPATVACRVLQVPRSTFYDRASRKPSARAAADAALLPAITRVHADSRGTYGAPRVHAELAYAHGLRIGRKRVARLMRAAGIEGVCHRRKSRHRPAQAVHDDLVKRDFTATGTDRVWFTDVTQHRAPWIPAAEGKLYVCAIKAAASTRIVGLSMGPLMTAYLACAALRHAIMLRRPAGTIVHSDMASQFRSKAFANILHHHRLRGSMGRVA